MRPRILVTGASGTVGSDVVRLLCDRQVPSVAVVRDAGKADAIEAYCAAVKVADFRDAASVRDAMEGTDKLLLITPMTADQVELGDTLIAAADDAGVDHVVKLSIIGAETRHGCRLVRWHRHMERQIERLDLRWTFLRPNGLYQNFLGSWGAAIPAEGRIYLPTGTAAVSYVDARDVAEAAVETLLGDGHDGEVYTLTGPAALTKAEIAAAIAAAAGRPVEYVDVPEDAARAALEQAGLVEPLTGAVLELWAQERSGAVAAVTPDLEGLLGRPPRPFADFARDHASAWAAQAQPVGGAASS